MIRRVVLFGLGMASTPALAQTSMSSEVAVFIAEDQTGADADFDYNDVVARCQSFCEFDTDNALTQRTVDCTLAADGGVLDNQIAIRGGAGGGGSLGGMSALGLVGLAIAEAVAWHVDDLFEGGAAMTNTDVEPSGPLAASDPVRVVETIAAPQPQPGPLACDPPDVSILRDGADPIDRTVRDGPNGTPSLFVMEDGFSICRERQSLDTCYGDVFVLGPNGGDWTTPTEPFEHLGLDVSGWTAPLWTERRDLP